MTIKTESELLTDFADGQFRGVTAEKIRHLIDSLGIGGQMYGSGTQGVSTTPAVFTAFTGVGKTRGITADTVAGTFTVDTGADGTFTVVVICTMTIPGNGQVQLRLRKNGSNTPFKSGAIDIVANEQKQIVLQGIGDLVAGDVIDFTIQGSGTATATVDNVSFRMER